VRGRWADGYAPTLCLADVLQPIPHRPRLQPQLSFDLSVSHARLAQFVLERVQVIEEQVVDVGRIV
jgi:hypothetical protein